MSSCSSRCTCGAASRARKASIASRIMVSVMLRLCGPGPGRTTEGGMFSAYNRIGESRYLQRIGLDFEDFSPGQRFRHRPGLTLSQQDNADEALETLNGAMLHFDAHYAAATAWQQPLMVSTLTLQRLVGMVSKTYGRRSAILGFDDIVMNGPLFGGDTLYAESEVLEVTSGGDISVMIRGHKPDGAEV